MSITYLIFIISIHLVLYLLEVFITYQVTMLFFYNLLESNILIV